MLQCALADSLQQMRAVPGTPDTGGASWSGSAPGTSSAQLDDAFSLMQAPGGRPPRKTPPPNPKSRPAAPTKPAPPPSPEHGPAAPTKPAPPLMPLALLAAAASERRWAGGAGDSRSGGRRLSNATLLTAALISLGMPPAVIDMKQSTQRSGNWCEQGRVGHPKLHKPRRVIGKRVFSITRARQGYY